MRFSSLNLEHVSKMMLFKSKILALSILFALVGSVISLAPAMAATGDVIVILDLGKILGNSKAMADVNSQVKILEEEFRTNGAAREKQLKEEREELNRQRVILPPESFEKKKKDFNKKALNFKNEMQSKLKQLSYSRSVSIRTIEKAMEPIVAKIAKDVGASMIVEQKQILFGEKTLDISDRVAADLNAKLSHVPVTLLPLPTK